MIYVSSSCIKKNNISEIIKQFVDNDIKNIELSGGTNYYDNLVKDLVDLKQMYGLQYACHAYFPPPKKPFVVNLASCNDEIYKRSIDHYVNCIEMLKYLECKILSIHAGFLVEIGVNEIGKQLSNRIIYEETKAYERFCYAYEKIEKFCKKKGISLFLENNVLSAENFSQFDYNNYMMMTDYASIMKMKEKLNFQLLLDLGHLFVSSNTLELDYCKECDMLQQHIKWIHISENNGVVDQHKPLRENSPIINELKKIYNPDINITLETEGNIENIKKSIMIVKRIHEEFCGGS